MPRVSCALAMVVAATGFVAVTAMGANAPIGAQQHFVGIVNGKPGPAVVYTVCPGPASSGALGQVESGQTLEVARASRGGGYTGLFNRIYAWFAPQPGGPTPVQVKFARYGKQKAIPSTVRVPCSGKGRVVFSSCPYLAPCAAGWTPTYVRVRFENVAD